MINEFLLSEKWVSDNAQSTRFTLPFSKQCRTGSFDSSLAVMRRLYSLINDENQYYPSILTIRDAIIVVWNWDINSLKRHYKYFIISKGMQIYHEPPTHSLHWLRSFPFLFTITDNAKSNLPEYKISKGVLDLPITQHINKALFCASSSQYGHWLCETFPTLKFALDLDRHDQIVITKPNSRQLKILSQYTKILDMKDRVSTIDIGNAQIAKFHIAELSIINGWNLRDKAEYIRLSLGRENVRSSTVLQQSFNKREKEKNLVCYLRRGIVNGERRIENESEVEKFIGEIGGEVIDCESIPENLLVEVCSRYDIVITVQSSSLLNFAFFTSNSPYVILLCTIPSQIDDLDVLLGANYYLTPFLDKLTFVFCETLGRSRISPVMVDLEILKSNLDQLSSLRKR